MSQNQKRFIVNKLRNKPIPTFQLGPAENVLTDYLVNIAKNVINNFVPFEDPAAEMK